MVKKYMHAAVMSDGADSGCLLAAGVMVNFHTCTPTHTPVSFLPPQYIHSSPFPEEMFRH
ncbi:hypothetical protein I79_010847 [Cricetulus griseus]|uniref:Uncharacterized protein n=1 Tax=Cricetulus griseus TaxID=10029 RepID=G3HJK0_CRIGR|nr:hypothetical protein I79_010847 [Cricetulus griseus]